MRHIRRCSPQSASLFDPVWEHLFPKEQARIVGLLVERSDFHAIDPERSRRGGEGTLEITFRDAGIKALREEFGDDE